MSITACILIIKNAKKQKGTNQLSYDIIILVQNIVRLYRSCCCSMFVQNTNQNEHMHSCETEINNFANGHLDFLD